MALEELNWDINPMEADYNSLNFNSYDKGPGARMPSRYLPPSVRQQLHEQQQREFNLLRLYVTRIPSEMTDTGLRCALTSLGCPKPTNVKLLRSKNVGIARDNFSYAFIDFETTREASEALQALDKRAPYYFRVNFANKTGEKERKERTIGSDVNANVASKHNGIDDSNDIWVATISSEDDEPTHVKLVRAKKLHPVSGPGTETSKNSNPNFKQPREYASFIEKIINLDKLVQIFDTRDQRCNTCLRPDFVEHLHVIMAENCILNPIEDMPDMDDISCSSCAKLVTDGFKLCVKCRQAFYCSKTCQINHWFRHKKDCAKELGKPVKEISNKYEANVNEGGDNISAKRYASTKSSDTYAQSSASSHDSSHSTSNEKEVYNEDQVDKYAVEYINNRENITVHISNDYKEIELHTPFSHTEKKVKERSLKIGDVFGFVLTFGSSPENFFIQKTDDADLARSMTRRLCDECSKIPIWKDAIKLKVGQYCAALFESDGLWYRARVLEKSEDRFLIEFIDFGNEEFVDIDKLRPLPPSLCDVPILAIHCKTRDIKPIGLEWSSAALEDFSLVIERKDFNECRVFDRSDHGIYIVDLFGSRGSLSDYLVKNKHAFGPSTQLEEARIQQTALKKEKPQPSEQSVPESIQDGKSSPSIEVTAPKRYPSIQGLRDSNSPQPPPSIEVTGPKRYPSVPGLRSSPLASRLKNALAKKEDEQLNIPSYIEKIKVGKTVNAMITNIHDLENFKYCLLLDVQSFCDISARLDTHFKNVQDSERLKNAKVGKIVAVQSSEKEWNRAFIMKLNEDGSYVCLYLDTGIIDTVDSVYKLPEEFFSIPSLFALAKVMIPFSKSALKQLNCEDPIEVSICITNFKEDEASARMKVTEQDITCNVSLKSYLNAYKEMLITFESELEEDSVDELFAKLPRANIKDGKILVVYQDPEDEWIIYGISHYDIAKQLVERMEDEVARGKPINSPKVGMYCLAKCETDAEWYRAMITEIGKESCKVYFLDFGNYGEVVNSDLKTIGDDYSPNALPAQAIKCIIAEEYRLPEAMKKVNDSKNNGECLNVTELSSENLHYVIMLNDV
ncbi:tudor domain-containing protein 1-like protein [Dinothrombium tinctorium]|uniref:Tudor domain-containing protein 1-like protein n=1 Tax=Dinothrombium tinctorium TaxID=1965070 RepID=A0A3S3P6H4_9ACAR|nr:tudor domain-containing protein 1-like protein [Dinothrombium tinctorium]RWS08970.1 tudor domain-containing protein 1-like protein [Dinothrombium tinctorium]